MFSKRAGTFVSKLGAETHGPAAGQENKLSSVPVAGSKAKAPQFGRGRENKIPAARPRARKQDSRSPAAGKKNKLPSVPVAGEKTRSPQSGRGRTLNMALR